MGQYDCPHRAVLRTKQQNEHREHLTEVQSLSLLSWKQDERPSYAAGDTFIVVCTYKVFRSADDVRKRESRHLWRSEFSTPTWAAPIREQWFWAGLSWSQLLLLLMVESITTVLYYRFHSPPAFRKGPRWST